MRKVWKFGTIVGAVLVAMPLTVQAVEEKPAVEVKKQTEAVKPIEAVQPAQAELPQAVQDALKAAFPNATIGRATESEKGSVKTYTVVLTEQVAEKGKKRYNVTVTAAGAIAQISTAIAPADLPKAVVDAVKAADAEAEIKGVTRIEERLDLRKDMAKIEPPRVTYTIGVAKGAQTGKMSVAEDGKVVRTLTWREVQTTQEK